MRQSKNFRSDTEEVSLLIQKEFKQELKSVSENVSANTAVGILNKLQGRLKQAYEMLESLKDQVQKGHYDEASDTQATKIKEALDSLEN